MDMTDVIFSQKLALDKSILPKYGAHWQT